ncbi:putative dehydrogenase [Aeromonas salmonicida]|nr:putative dehydrogenase [Aeromonas salmonicida]
MRIALIGLGDIAQKAYLPLPEKSGKKSGTPTFLTAA